MRHEPMARAHLDRWVVLAPSEYFSRSVHLCVYELGHIHANCPRSFRSVLDGHL